jgi:hypothetical protein
MRHRLLLTAAALAALLAATPGLVPVMAQTAPAAPAVDPAVMRRLSAMSAYLKTLRSFEVQTSTTIEEIADDNDSKLTISGTGLYRVRRPDAFYVEVNTETQRRQFWYDGRQFTIFVPTKGYYAQMTAPGTIRETLDQAYLEFGVALPLADIFNWGENDLPPGELTRARLVASDVMVGGAKTDHYAFGSKDLDWQLWIEQGAQPLPRRVIITTITDPAKPSYSADLTWKASTTFPAETFAFRPPPSSKAITLARVEADQ